MEIVYEERGKRHIQFVCCNKVLMTITPHGEAGDVNMNLTPDGEAFGVKCSVCKKWTILDHSGAVHQSIFIEPS